MNQPNEDQAQDGGGFLPIICYPFQLNRSSSSSDNSQPPSVKRSASRGGRATPSVDDAIAQLSRNPSFIRQISSASKSKHGGSQNVHRVPSSRPKTPTYQERAPPVASYHEDANQFHRSHSRSFQGDNYQINRSHSRSFQADNGQFHRSRSISPARSQMGGNSQFHRSRSRSPALSQMGGNSQFHRSRSRSPARSQMGSIYGNDIFQPSYAGEQTGFFKNKNKLIIAACGVLVAGALIFLSTSFINKQVDQRMGVTLSAPRDADGDGISDGIEFQIGMNPNNADSDFDGISDGDEVVAMMTGAATAMTSHSHGHSSKSSKSYISSGCGGSGSSGKSGKSGSGGYSSSGKSSKCSSLSYNLGVDTVAPAPTPDPTPAPTQAPTSLFPSGTTGGYFVDDPDSECFREHYMPIIDANEYAGCSFYWHTNVGDRRSTSAICENNPYNTYGSTPENRYCLSIEVRPGCVSFEGFQGGNPILFSTSIAWDWSAYLVPFQSPDTSTCAKILTDPEIDLRPANESVGGAPGYGTGLPGTTGQCYDVDGFPVNPDVNQATSTVTLTVNGNNYVCNVVEGGTVCKMWGLDDGQPSNFDRQYIPFRCPDIEGDVYEGHVNLAVDHFSLTPNLAGLGNAPNVIINKSS